jgi:hypothetical protein
MIATTWQLQHLMGLQSSGMLYHEIGHIRFHLKRILNIHFTIPVNIQISDFLHNYKIYLNFGAMSSFQTNLQRSFSNLFLFGDNV